MKTYVVCNLYTGSELGILYAKNEKQAWSRAGKLYSGRIHVREYGAHLDRLVIEQEAAKYE